MAITIKVQTTLDTDAVRVWEAMKHPASFLYVCRGLFAWPALVGRTAPIRPGEAGQGWLFLFHVVPLYRRTIEVVSVDETTMTIRSYEHGGALRRWDHTLHVEPAEDSRCRYSDTVEIDAGALTALVAFTARWSYRYRQRRWHRLVSKHLRPGGPSYGLPRPDVAGSTGSTSAVSTLAGPAPCTAPD
jgi:hypothetical protein